MELTSSTANILPRAHNGILFILITNIQRPGIVLLLSRAPKYRSDIANFTHTHTHRGINIELSIDIF